MNVVGAVMSSVIGAGVDLFYRRRILDGSIPERGPVLLVANHPNALIDPAIIMNSTRRRVRMLAKAPLFSMPVLSWLVKGLDCLPVYRAKDGADTTANASTFRAVQEALCQGSCVLIFPEGISHDEPSLQPLKTGAARMAIGAVRQGAVELVVVPVGLTYADKLRYRSTAAVDIGPPIRVVDFIQHPTQPGADDDDDDDRDAVRRLTDAMHEALLQETTNLESWQDWQLLQIVDVIWRQRDPERVTRMKRLADGVALLRAHEPARLDAFRERLGAWVHAIDELGLTPRQMGEVHLTAAQDPLRAATFIGRQLVALLVGLPLATTGAIVWAPPFWLVHAIWRLSGYETDTGATVKVLASVVIFPLWWLCVMGGLIIADLDVVAIGFGALGPWLGLLTRHFFRRRAFALRQIADAVKLWLQGRVGDDVRAERDALCIELDALAARVEALRTTSG